MEKLKVIGINKAMYELLASCGPCMKLMINIFTSLTMPSKKLAMSMGIMNQEIS